MQTAEQVLDREFLETRCMLIEIGAMLDRYDRATGTKSEDQRLDLIYRALALLAKRPAEGNRSEQLLNLFTELD